MVTKIRFEVFNEPRPKTLDLDEHPDLRSMPVDEAIEEALRIVSDAPEQAFRPGREHDIVAQPSEGYAQPVYDRRGVLDDVLARLAGEEVVFRLGAQARQADGTPAGGR